VAGYSLNLMLANKSADSKHVGVALGRICIKAGVSVSSIAERFDVSRQTVYNWFEGRVTPNKRIIESIKEYTTTLKHEYKNGI
jgi:transcriptional regulator with XRE-family HTH domain